MYNNLYALLINTVYILNAWSVGAAAASVRTSLFSSPAQPAASAYSSSSATSYSDDFEALVLSRMRAAAAARSTAATTEKLSATTTATTTVSASCRPDRSQVSEHIDLTGADAERSRPAADDSSQSTDALTKTHNKVVVLD